MNKNQKKLVEGWLVFLITVVVAAFTPNELSYLWLVLLSVYAWWNKSEFDKLVQEEHSVSNFLKNNKFWRNFAFLISTLYIAFTFFAIFTSKDYFITIIDSFLLFMFVLFMPFLGPLIMTQLNLFKQLADKELNK
jgi:hypothetical protein